MKYTAIFTCKGVMDVRVAVLLTKKVVLIQCCSKNEDCSELLGQRPHPSIKLSVVKARVVGRKLKLYVITFVLITFHTEYVNVQDADMFVCSVIKTGATTLIVLCSFASRVAFWSYLDFCTSVVLFGGLFVRAH